MPALGTFLLYLALFASVYAVIAGTIAGRTRRLDLILSSERAITAQFVLVAICFVLLEYFFLTDRFDVYFVAKSSSRHLPTLYKVTALWSAMEGSLLLWSLVLATFTLIAVHIVKRRRGPGAAYATAIMAANQVFFLGIILLYENPIHLISAVERVPVGIAH